MTMTKKNVKKILSVVLAVCMMLLLIPMRSDAAAAAPMVEYQCNVARKIVYDGVKTATTVLTGLPYVKKVEPNDVILVIDVSGSMLNHIDNMKVAAKDFVNKLNLVNHRVGIVTYGSDADGFEITNNRSNLLSTINDINAGGGTRIDLGIEKAVELLQNKRQDVQGSIVLMTDGAQDPNYKGNELTAAEAAKSAGYYFYTVALAPENSTPDKNLKKMATSEADHYSRMYSDQLSQVYDDLADKIGTCNAKDVELTIDVGSDFELLPDSVENNIPKPEINGSTLTWKFPQLSGGDSSVWYDFTPKAGIALGDYPTMGGTLSYTNYLGDRVVVTIPPTMVSVTEYPPEITAVNPVIYDGLSPREITVIGNHFNPQAKLYLDGVEQTNITVTDTSIKFTAPAVNAIKSMNIKVVNPDGQYDYGVLNAGPNPTLTSINPEKNPCNTAANVEIFGKDFKGNKFTIGVYVGGKKCDISLVTADKLIAKFPALPVGTYDVMVKNDDGGVAVLPNAYTTYDPNLNKPGPQITYISPNTVEEKKTAVVDIYGSGFVGNKFTLKVTVNGTAAPIKVITSDKVTVTVPALDAGTYDVVVTNSDGGSTTVAGGMTYEAKAVPAPVPPVVTSITPNEGDQNKTHKVDIIGSGFSGNKFTIGVTVGGSPATINVVTTNKLTVTLPKMAAGAYDVVVKNADGGTATVTNGFKYVDSNANKPGPQITSITPNKVEEKKKAVVDIYGSGFVGNKFTLKVTVNGTAAPVKVITSDKVTVTVPALDAGTYDVVVTNSDGGSTTVAGGMTYEAKAVPAPVPPVVTSITPNEGDQNKTHKVDIIGSGFSGNKFTIGVTVGGSPATINVVTTNKLTVTLPKMAAGAYDVVVKNADGGTATVTNGFKYVDPNANKPGPQITSITPNKVEEKKTAVVDIYGSGFVGNKFTLKVTVNGTAAPVKVITADKITVTVPALDAGTYDVVVTNSDGGSTTVAGGMTYEAKAAPAAPKPTISKITPNTCEENKTQKVDIYGSNFSGNKYTIGVTVGGKPATINVVAADKLTVTVPAQAEGSYDVEVTNADGQAVTLANGMTYEKPVVSYPTPVITSVTPGTLEANKTGTITIQGSNFEGNKFTLSVDVDGNPATITVITSDKIVATAPALAEGTYDVTVKNSTGTSAVKNNALTYVAPVVPGKPVPKITSLSTGTTQENQTAKITINGSGFSGNRFTLKVMVDTKEALISSITPTAVTVTVPSMPAGSYDVTVINDDGTKSTLANGLTYVAKPLSKPVITGLSVTTCPANQTSKIIIYGSEFISNKFDATVKINNIEAQITVITADKVYVTVPALTAGSYDVTYSNKDGGSCTSPVKLTYV